MEDRLLEESSLRLIVVGTGTDVGKTHVSACLLAHARSLGLRAGGYKPIATGVSDRCEDADRLAEALGIAPEPPTFSYPEPISPHLAARKAGRAIDIEAVRERANRLTTGVDVLLIESAGGLFSPLAEGPRGAITNLDLAKRLLPGLVLLVASDRLGVLHDVSASVIAARANGLSIPAIILSAPMTPDASTGANAAEIERLGVGSVLGVFPNASFDAMSSRETAARIWERLTDLT